MKMPDSLVKAGIDPITHKQIKSYGNEYLFSLKSDLEESVRKTKREEWREAKYYGQVLTMVKTEMAHRRLT